MDAFYDAASRYDEEMKRSSEFQKTYSDIRSRKKSADTRRKGRDQEIADLEKKKNGLFREIRPVNRTGADSVLKLLSAMDYRKEIPVPDAVVNAFFRENGIEEQPFDDRTYQKMLREYIAQETGRVFPVPLSQELAAVQKRIQKTFAVPKSGDVISVECTSGPFQGKSIRDTFYGLDGSSIRMGHRSISLRDLSPEDRMRFDPRGVEQLKAKYFEKRKRELVENREKFEASVRAEKADALRNEWAWSFGWLPERGNKYVSIRALAAKWHDLTLRQIALDRENAEDREAMKKDLAQFYEKLRNGDSFDRLFYALSVLEDPDSGGSSRERDEAFSILQDAAEHSVLAQSALGYAYLNGEMGLEKSPEKAFPLLKKAADQGAPGPIRKVAEMLRNGIGTGADREKAEKYRNALPVQEE